MPSHLSKKEIIRAASCLPFYDHVSILSEQTQSRIDSHVAKYAAGKKGLWNYSDLRKHFWSLYKLGNLDGVLSGIGNLAFPEEITAKTMIVKAVAQHLEPESFQAIEFSAPAHEISENFEFVPLFDVVIRRKNEIHCVFVNPYSDFILKNKQRELLLKSLSFQPKGYHEKLVLDYFEFPKESGKRRPVSDTIEFGYYQLDEVFDHYARFHNSLFSGPRTDGLF